MGRVGVRESFPLPCILKTPVIPAAFTGWRLEICRSVSMTITKEAPCTSNRGEHHASSLLGLADVLGIPRTDLCNTLCLDQKYP